MQDIMRIRHSLSHVMAEAVKEIYKDVKLAIGPAIDNGFYYDFDIPQAILPEDLQKIEDKMKEIIKKDFDFTQSFMTKDEARKFFANEPYKLELIF